MENSVNFETNVVTGQELHVGDVVNVADAYGEFNPAVVVEINEVVHNGFTTGCNRELHKVTGVVQFIDDGKPVSMVVEV